MNTSTVHEQRIVLRRATERALLAPSVHNTQPWRWTLSDDGLALHADRHRQLHQLDPTGRQLVISCGCALFNVRVAVAAEGHAVRVVRFPDPAQPDLLARITIEEGIADAQLAPYDELLPQRHTSRRSFLDETVPEADLEALEKSASVEHARLIVVHHEDHRLAVAELSQKADAMENLSRAYRAELRQWTTDDPHRRDGVPAMAVPHVESESFDEVPVRDFDTTGMGWLPEQTRSSHRQCLALLATDNDDPAAWLRAGEALQRVLLELTARDFVAGPLTQVTEVPATRAELRDRLGMTSYPHVLLRIGRAALTPTTPRRDLKDVLTETW